MKDVAKNKTIYFLKKIHTTPQLLQDKKRAKKTDYFYCNKAFYNYLCTANSANIFKNHKPN